MRRGADSPGLGRHSGESRKWRRIAESRRGGTKSLEPTWADLGRMAGRAPPSYSLEQYAENSMALPNLRNIVCHLFRRPVPDAADSKPHTSLRRSGRRSRSASTRAARSTPFSNSSASPASCTTSPSRPGAPPPPCPLRDEPSRGLSTVACEVPMARCKVRTPLVFALEAAKHHPPSSMDESYRNG